MTENRQWIWTLGFLLAVSLVVNVVLLREKNVPTPHTEEHENSVLGGPGFKGEVVTVFDGERHRTYATSSPLSENDIRKMNMQVEKEFDRMRELFRRQDEFFRALWEF